MRCSWWRARDAMVRAQWFCNFTGVAGRVVRFCQPRGAVGRAVPFCCIAVAVVVAILRPQQLEQNGGREHVWHKGVSGFPVEVFPVPRPGLASLRGMDAHGGLVRVRLVSLGHTCKAFNGAGTYS